MNKIGAEIHAAHRLDAIAALTRTDRFSSVDKTSTCNFKVEVTKRVKNIQTCRPDGKCGYILVVRNRNIMREQQRKYKSDDLTNRKIRDIL